MAQIVSVVIPTYDGSAFVSAAISSALSQTRVPDEIIVVDDCSTDNTGEVVQSRAADSPVPVHFMRLPRNSGGPAAPLNHGINSSAGDVLVLLDQDDLMRPNRIELQLAALSSHPECSISIGRFSIIGRDDDDVSPIWPVSQLHDLRDHINGNSPFSVVTSEAAFKPLLQRNYAVSTSNFAFTRAMWETIGDFDEKVSTCIDLDFMLRATSVAPLLVVNEYIFEYRWDPASLQRRDLTRSLLESTMVRLRAASQKPDWAAEEIDALRHSALILANASIRKGDFSAVRSIAETMAKHKGLVAVRQSLNNKRRALIRLPKR
jgi:glycosyltransferase involved in cell wall biosynthesis